MNETIAFWIFVAMATVNMLSDALGMVFDVNDATTTHALLLAIASGVLAIAAKRGASNG